MRKLLLIVLFLAVYSFSFADESFVLHSWLEKTAMFEVAKFFDFQMLSKNGDCDTYTDIITFQKDESGKVFHVAWYADGYVITQIGGDASGIQTVVCNGEIIGISYPAETRHRICENVYTWGRIYTQPERQEIVR